MIFQHTWEKVLSGEKTQTRRLKKSAEWFWYDGATIEGGQHRVFYDPACIDDTKTPILNPRCVYGVGKTYAVQPGRGMKSIGRIQITNIRREDVRQISYADCKAEGFIDRSDFILTWCQMHDRSLGVIWYDCFHWKQGREWREGYHDFYDYLQSRPAERYQAWVLEFQLVK